MNAEQSNNFNCHTSKFVQVNRFSKMEMTSISREANYSSVESIHTNKEMSQYYWISSLREI